MGAGKPGMMKPGMNPGAPVNTPFGGAAPQPGKPPIKLAGGAKPVS